MTGAPTAAMTVVTGARTAAMTAVTGGRTVATGVLDPGCCGDSSGAGAVVRSLTTASGRTQWAK